MKLLRIILGFLCLTVPWSLGAQTYPVYIQATPPGNQVPVVTPNGLVYYPQKIGNPIVKVAWLTAYAFNGVILSVTDGANAADCTVGGGAFTVVCQYNGSAWTAHTGPQGPQGETGARGSLWYEDAGAPGTISGQANGDLYLNTTNSDVYQLQTGTWTLIGNIKGIQGSAGSNGTNGARGSLWYEGAGAPGTISGQADGDLYLDTTSGDVYQLSGTWTKVGNIVGPTGGSPDQLLFNTGSGTGGVPGSSVSPGGAVYLNPTVLSTPAAPAVTPTPPGGSTTWGYQVIAMFVDELTDAGPEQDDDTGPATLNGSNYETVITPTVAGSTGCLVFRSAAGGPPYTTGYLNLGSPVACGSNFVDNGVAGDGSDPPTVNRTYGSGVPWGVGNELQYRSGPGQFAPVFGSSVDPYSGEIYLNPSVNGFGLVITGPLGSAYSPFLANSYGSAPSTFSSNVTAPINGTGLAVGSTLVDDIGAGVENVGLDIVAIDVGVNAGGDSIFGLRVEAGDNIEAYYPAEWPSELAAILIVPPFNTPGPASVLSGMHIKNQSPSLPGSAVNAAILLDSQTPGPNVYGIKSGAGPVDFGDIVSPGILTLADGLAEITTSYIGAALYTPIGAPGMNDVAFSGTYTGAANETFCIVPDDVAGDTFSWGVNSDCATFVAIGVAMTGTPQLLQDGVSVDFPSSTGYTENDHWTSLATAALGDGFEFNCANCDTPPFPGAACTATGDHAGARAIYIESAMACYGLTPGSPVSPQLSVVNLTTAKLLEFNASNSITAATYNDDGTTTYAGVFNNCGDSNALIGGWYTVAGFGDANDGNFGPVVTCTAGTLRLPNSSGITESGTATATNIGFQLVAAQGAGEVIVPQTLMGFYTPGGTGFTLGFADNEFMIGTLSGAAWYVSNGSLTVHGFPAFGWLDNTNLSQVAASGFYAPSPADSRDIPLLIELSGTTPALTGGDGSVQINLQYSVMVISGGA